MAVIVGAGMGTGLAEFDEVVMVLAVVEVDVDVASAAEVVMQTGWVVAAGSARRVPA